MSIEEVPINQILSKDTSTANGEEFAKMPDDQRNLQMPVTSKLPSGYGQGQQPNQREMFSTSSFDYMSLLVIFIIVCIVAFQLPNHFFRTIGVTSLVDHENKLTLMGIVTVGILAIIVYFLATIDKSRVMM
jgi:hypothetical protein